VRLGAQRRPRAPLCSAGVVIMRSLLARAARRARSAGASCGTPMRRSRTKHRRKSGRHPRSEPGQALPETVSIDHHAHCSDHRYSSARDYG
jgi:hypothetical protein